MFYTGKGLPSHLVVTWVKGMRSAENTNPVPSRPSITIIGVALGLAVALCISAQGPYFWSNFAGYWLPQAAVLAMAMLFKASRAVLGGVALTMALYLYLFDSWATESMAWLFYLFSFPGVLVGALLASVAPSRKPYEVLIAAGWVILGIVVNLTIMLITMA